jgi:hypothetical protein
MTAAQPVARASILLLLLLQLVQPSAAWSAGHAAINSAVLDMLRNVKDNGLLDKLHATNTTWPPGPGGASGSVASFVAGVWAESGDTVAGPCSSSPSTPCGAPRVRADMALRDFCYAEDSKGAQTPPWPYQIPVCENTTGQPPTGWAACIKGPKTEPWLYHYFTETPAANHGFEARGGSWYLARASAALRAGNASAAALYLSCFSHGLEDRSAPYHNFGGFEDQRAAIDTRYNLTATCEAGRAPGDGHSCFVRFWASNDGGMQGATDRGFRGIT